MSKHSQIGGDHDILGNLSITGITQLGISTTSGTNRTIQAIGSGADLDVLILSKGIGVLKTRANHDVNTSADEDIVNLKYFKTHLGTKPTSTLLQTPTVTEDGYVIKWDNVAGKFTLSAGSGGGSLTNGSGTTSAGTAVNLGGALTSDATLTGAFKFTIGDSILRLRNPGNTFSYTIASSAIVADRTLTIPLLTGNDVMVTEAFIQTLSNKTLSAPKFVNAGFIADSNGNKQLQFNLQASASNYFAMTNNTSSLNPILSVIGSGTNIGFDFQAKGTGTYKFLGTSAQAAELRLYEDTDDGTNYTAFKVGTQSVDLTYTLPNAAPASNGYLLSSTTAGVMSWVASPPIQLSSIIGATTTNTIDNNNNAQLWQFSGFTTSIAFQFYSSSTVRVNGSQLFNVTSTGGNASSGITTLAAQIANAHSGTTSTNIALELTSSGGTTNYALSVIAGHIKIGLGTNLLDGSGNEFFIFSSTASAVNEVTFANAATGTNPKFTASGGDTNIGFDFLTKGTGVFRILGNSTQQAEIRLFENTGSGTNYIGFKTVASLSGDLTYTLPSAAPIASNNLLTSDTSGVMSWSTDLEWSSTKVFKVKGSTNNGTTNLQEWRDSSGTLRASLNSAGLLTLGSNTVGVLSITGSSSGQELFQVANFAGTKVFQINDAGSPGTRIGFFGVTPSAQITTGITAETFVANTSGIANDTATWGGYKVGQIVAALKTLGFLA